MCISEVGVNCPFKFPAVVSHSESWYEVSSLVVVGAGWRSLHRRPHPVLVVLADEDARQLPQGGHVERLEQLALIGSEGTGVQTNIFLLTVRDFSDSGRIFTWLAAPSP